MTGRLRDYYTTEQMEDMIARALRFAETPTERQFVESVQDRYEHYGPDMFVSERQLDWLFSIASYSDDDTTTGLPARGDRQG